LLRLKNKYRLFLINNNKLTLVLEDQGPTKLKHIMGQQSSSPIKASRIAFAILIIVLAYLLYRNCIINQKQQELYNLYRKPENPIPHTNTTTPAPGYTSDLAPGCSRMDRNDTKKRALEVPDKCPEGEDKIGFICYTKCPEKWKAHPEFPDTCQRCKDYSDSCEFMDMIIQKRVRTGTAVSCRPGWDKYGGLCYAACPSGYLPEADLCIRCIK
jgi:hypothetical protein